MLRKSARNKKIAKFNHRGHREGTELHGACFMLCSTGKENLCFYVVKKISNYNLQKSAVLFISGNLRETIHSKNEFNHRGHREGTEHHGACFLLRSTGKENLCFYVVKKISNYNLQKSAVLFISGNLRETIKSIKRKA